MLTYLYAQLYTYKCEGIPSHFTPGSNRAWYMAWGLRQRSVGGSEAGFLMGRPMDGWSRRVEWRDEVWCYNNCLRMVQWLFFFAVVGTPGASVLHNRAIQTLHSCMSDKFSTQPRTVLSRIAGHHWAQAETLGVVSPELCWCPFFLSFFISTC